MDTENESIVHETPLDNVIDIGDDKETNESVDGSSSQTPLKRYVTFLPVEKGRAIKWICGFGCRTMPYTGTYSRIRAHLIGLLPGQKAQGISMCSKVKKEEREKMKQEEVDAQKLGESGKRASISIVPTVTSSSVSGRRGIEGMFDTSSRSDVDAIIARCFYADGLPFNFARSPFFYDMIRAVNEAPKGYKPPSSEKIRTTLLEKEKGRVEKALIPLKDLWPTFGVSIVSDGWTNIKNQSLINVMAISNGKAMFLSSVDCSGDEKTGEFISELLLDAIDKVGRYSVVQVLTDNAANCKKAGDLISAVYPHISWSGCMAHTLSLLMKDIANPKDKKSMAVELAFVADVYGKAKKVIDYIKHHSLAQYIFRSYSELDVIQTKKTRFGSHYVMLERIVRVKRHLINMVLGEEWAKIKKGRSKQNTDHDQVRKTVLDEDFWDNAKLVLSFTKPIWLMIRFCDSDKSVIGVVYPKMRIMLENIKEALVDLPGIREAMENLVISRWEMMNRPLHSLAYVLNPYFHSQAWLKGDLGRKPHADPYVSSVYLGIVDKMVRDATERIIIRQQIGDFLSCKGPFARPQAIADRNYMAATTWWGMYGVTTIELHSLAVKILAQSVNSSCAERAWSTYSYIHSVKRNNLNASRAESLVYIHYNQRLLSRYRKDYEEAYKNWDVFANNDNLDFDNEGVEDREYRELFNVNDASLEPPASQDSQAHGSLSGTEEMRRHETGRGKRPHPE